jgi:rhomboid protease GluP
VVEKRRMCPHCRAFITTKDRVCPYCDTKVGPRAVDRRAPGEILGGLISQAHFTTSMILLLNFGLYAATVIYSMQTGRGGGWMGLDGQTLFEFGAKTRYHIFMGQWWRLVTAGFLHGGMLHIFMNSWVLFDLGAQVEEVYGTRRFLVFYITSTIFGFLASAFWSASLSVGASAGLFGLIGAMIAIGVRYPSSVASAMRGLYVRWAVYMLVIGFLPGLRIDNAAHIGGLAAGFCCGYLAGLPSPLGTPGERVWRIAAYVAVLLTLYSFLQMFLWFKFGTD